MKKNITLIAVVLLVAVFGAVGFAEKQGGKGPGGRREFTPQQKAEFVEYMTKRNKITEDFLRAQVTAGQLSKKEADAHIVIMKERMTRLQAARPQLTAEQVQAQRAARQEYRKKMTDLRIESVKKSMESGSLDKERGEKILKALENPEKGNRGKHGGYGKHAGWNDNYFYSPVGGGKR